jgi:hypothetical protein
LIWPISQHFTYAENLTKDELMQGDVLERTPALDKLLSEVHPYYFGKLKNQYFMVLTQSCDLVPRQPSGEPKARYISLSPVRTLDHVIDLQMQLFRASVKAELPVISDKSKVRMSEFLQRLFNNNVPDYFFLAANGPVLTSDYAVFRCIASCERRERDTPPTCQAAPSPGSWRRDVASASLADSCGRPCFSNLSGSSGTTAEGKPGKYRELTPCGQPLQGILPGIPWILGTAASLCIVQIQKSIIKLYEPLLCIKNPDMQV